MDDVMDEAMPMIPSVAYYGACASYGGVPEGDASGEALDSATNSWMSVADWTGALSDTGDDFYACLMSSCSDVKMPPLNDAYAVCNPEQYEAEVTATRAQCYVNFTSWEWADTGYAETGAGTDYQMNFYTCDGRGFRGPKLQNVLTRVEDPNTYSYTGGTWTLNGYCDTTTYNALTNGLSEECLADYCTNAEDLYEWLGIGQNSVSDVMANRTAVATARGVLGADSCP